MNGQKVIVLGGSSGIGLATAKGASDWGADVIIAARTAEKLEEASTQIDIATADISQFDEKTTPKVWLKSGEIYLDLAKADFALINLKGESYEVKYPQAPKKAYEAYTATLALSDLKKYYKTEGVTKKDFTNALIEFVNDPVEGKAKIPQATEHFGLMPKFNFSNEQLGQIANYIYRTELETTDWYTNHYEEEKQKYKI